MTRLLQMGLHREQAGRTCTTEHRVFGLSCPCHNPAAPGSSVTAAQEVDALDTQQRRSVVHQCIARSAGRLCQPFFWVVSPEQVQSLAHAQ
jgi:hypothetical protein